MLSYLSVKNFAILENIEVSFESGLTALTGETGAGKSLLIDAIGLLLGDRASTSIVRTNAEYCEVKGLFKNVSETVKAALKAIDIVETDELLIVRQISKTAQNQIKINHQIVTLQDLRTVTKTLADIHTQHDTKRLINPETYIQLIDHFDDSINELVDDYTVKRQNYLKALKDYNKQLTAKETQLEKQDYYRFVLEELKNHHLVEDEDTQIETELNSLKNFDTIYQAIKETATLLNDKEALESIFDASSSLKRIETYNDDYAALSSRIQSAYYELDDVKSDVNALLKNLDFDPDELDRLETRNHTLDQLKRKYRKSINELIEYQEELSESLDQLDNYDDVLSTLKEAVNKTYDTALKSAITLSERRKKQALIIEKKLVGYLKDLELKDVLFNIEIKQNKPSTPFDDQPFKGDGIDTIDFYLSTNIGETPKPLSNVASGGELSRIMLALKEILIENMQVSLMIFDEIDTGISGYVASQVAKKMQKIAKTTQVITITHLPQVAAKADTHAYIYKKTEHDRTKAFIKTLDYDGRINALAEMISSENITESALKSAEELLK